MKKIIGILLAGALVTSAFAADVSAKVNILGSAFNFNANGNKVGALAIAEGGQSWNPSFQMSVNGDVAGASMSFFDPKATGAVSNVNYSIWFKPFDMLKVTVGNFSTNLNQETIDYSNTATGIDSNGIALSLNTSGFFADVFFAPGWSDGNFGWNRTDNAKYWFGVNGDKVSIAETYVRVGYGADFGTISAYFNYVGHQDNSANSREAQWSEEDVMDFGIGYKNTFGSVEMFANAIVGMHDSKMGTIRGELFAKTQIDALGLAAFVVGGYAMDPVMFLAKDKLADATKADAAFVGATAKVTYSLGSVTPYLYLKGNNFLADAFQLVIKPGITGNVGSMSWDLAVEFTAQEKIVIDVPVVFTVAW